MQETVEEYEYHLTSQMILTTALRHFEAMLDYYGDAGLYMFRKHLSFYVKDGPYACDFRRKLMTTDSIESVKKGLLAFFRTCE